jgi:hypothetical protein
MKNTIKVLIGATLLSIGLVGCGKSSTTTNSNVDTNIQSLQIEEAKNYQEKLQSLLEINKKMFGDVSVLIDSMENFRDDVESKNIVLSEINEVTTIIADLQVMADDNDIRYDLKMMHFGLIDMKQGIDEQNKVTVSDGFKDYLNYYDVLLDDYDKNIVQKLKK